VDARPFSRDGPNARTTRQSNATESSVDYRSSSIEYVRRAASYLMSANIRSSGRAPHRTLEDGAIRDGADFVHTDFTGVQSARTMQEECVNLIA
jgi:hypothetical protein